MTRIDLRLPDDMPELVAWLKWLAKQNRRSLNAEIVYALERYVEQNKKMIEAMRQSSEKAKEGDQ